MKALTAGQEGEPYDHIAVGLSILHSSRSRSKDLPVNTRNRIETLSRKQETYELAQILRVEPKRDDSSCNSSWDLVGGLGGVDSFSNSERC